MPQPTTRTRSAANTNTEKKAATMPAIGTTGTGTTLSANQVQAVEHLVQHLDGTVPRKTLALIGGRGSGKTTLIRDLLESRNVRHTSLHRRVIGTVVDATQLADGLSAWQYLIFAVLERLVDATQPTPPQIILDLHGELRNLVKIDPKNEQAVQLATAAFAHHFRTAWQSIVLNSVAKANATFVVALDHVDEVSADQATQLMEAAKYFLNAPGCTCVLCADADLLIDKLDRSAPGTDGEAILNSWAAARVELQSSAFNLPRTVGRSTTSTTQTPSKAPAAEAQPISKSTSRAIKAEPEVAAPSNKQAPQPQQHSIKPATTPAAVTASAAAHMPKPTGKIDVPEAVYGMLHTWLQADGGKINTALTQWRTAMRGIMKRAQEGQRTGINSEHITKIVAMRQLCPELFDAARFDAAMLVGLERRAGHPKLAEVGNEFDKVIANNAQLKTLFKAQPLFSNLETRDLATALRLCNVDELVMEGASVGTDAPAAALPEPMNVRRTTVREVALPQINGRWMPLIITVSTVTAGMFVIDRLPKLFIEPGKPALNGLFELATVSRDTASLMNSSLAIGAELISVALALLMLVFWGASRATGRGGTLYATSFGLILGAMAANLVDRLAYGAVLNYIHIGNLPVFNLAHIGLLLGAALLAVSMFLHREPANAVTE